MRLQNYINLLAILKKVTEEFAETGVDFLLVLGERGKKSGYETTISELRSATKADDLIEIINSATGDPLLKVLWHY